MRHTLPLRTTIRIARQSAAEAKAQTDAERRALLNEMTPQQQREFLSLLSPADAREFEALLKEKP